MPLPLPGPPASVCLLRLSAIGDVVHAVPLIRTLQRYWPATRLTWLIGKPGALLVGDMKDVEFIIYDKARGRQAWRDLQHQLAGRRFDVLINTQASLRANLLSTLAKADVRLGYDRVRARDLQGLFINHRIAAAPRQHVLDGFFGFLKALGLAERELRWDIPIPPEARAFAELHLPGPQPTLIVSPCSTRKLRNWRADRYAAVADYAAQIYGMRVAICGGRTALERNYGDAIAARMRHVPLDLIGKDTLKQLLALLARANILLSPDSGPAHIATAAGTPVLGLYAASNPQRTGPYLSRDWCVDKYDAAARRYAGKPATELRWEKRLEIPGAMDLIEVDEVIERLDALVRSQPPRASAEIAT